MKKFALLLIVSLLAFSTFSTAHARGNVAEIIAGNQDYLLLATVVDIDDSFITLAPYHAIYVDSEPTASSSLNENITVSKFRYSYCDEHSDISSTPRVGDNIFISINKSGSGYAMLHGAYKISSVDYKLLTFHASESMKDSECLADIVSLAYFVRTDGSMRSFAYENGILTADIDGRPLTLYPDENLAETVTFVNINGQVLDNIKTKDIIIEGEAHEEEAEDYRWIISYGILLIGVLAGGAVVYNATAKNVLDRKREKKEKKQ